VNSKQIRHDWQASRAAEQKLVLFMFVLDSFALQLQQKLLSTRRNLRAVTIVRDCNFMKKKQNKHFAWLRFKEVASKSAFACVNFLAWVLN
jgi:hypothetical protein